MAEKEIKGLLKEAREQIKSKEYKSALKECKKVLNKDKNNYMALVFCGLCLSELDQPDPALQVRESSPEYKNIKIFSSGLQASVRVLARPGDCLGRITEILRETKTLSV